MPLRLMMCGDPAALSWMVIDPDRRPAAVGTNVAENVQVPAAGTVSPQSLVSVKSPLTVIAEIESGALPMFRKSVVVAGPLDPTGWLEYSRRNGVDENAGPESGAILSRNALLVPFKVVWNPPPVAGKSPENDSPPT